MKIGEYAKTVTGGLITFGVLFDAATAPGSVGGDGVTSAEWVRIAVGTVVAALGVFLVPNSPAPATITVRTTASTVKAPEGYVGEHGPR